MKYTIIIILSMLILGCAVTSDVMVSEPLNGSLKGYRHVHVEVERGERVDNLKGFNVVKENLLSAVTTKIPPRTGMSVSDKESNPELSLKITVTDLSYTSQGARIMAGIMSGRAILKTDVVLKDNNSNKILWKVQTNAESKNSQGVFGGSTTTQVEALSNQIIAEFEKHL